MHRTVFVLALLLAVPASAQRSVEEIPEIDAYTLSSLITGEQHRIERCATRTDASAYVATVQARVSPGSMPATLFNARISVSVVSRPRDPELEACVRRELVDAIRHAEYAVGGSVRARHTFQISERPEPPIDRRPPPYSEQEVHQVIGSRSRWLSQCLEIAGIPESVTLRVAVRPDGRLVLMSANVPPGAGRGALGCLSSRVSALRVSGRPPRSVGVVYQLAVQSRGF